MAKVAGEGCKAAFMLPPHIKKNEIAEGTEIWILKD
jgi:hypothetical protein